MKNFFFSLLLFLQIPMIATAAEAYAVYTNGTLTFYYDNSKNSRSGTKYALNTGENNPGWYTDHRLDIKKAVFNSTFASARPTSTYRWFANEYLEPVLSEIVGIQYLNTSEVTTMRDMFSFCEKLTSLDVSNFDTGKVKSMNRMFCRCWSMTNLDVRNFDTSNVTDMYDMFFMCSSLQSLDVRYFDTSNVTDMKGMFYGCRKLTSLDISHFNTSKVTNMCIMFRNCVSLTTLDLSHFDTSKVTDMSEMFYYCSSITNCDVSNFDTKNVLKMYSMFRNCNSLPSLDISNFDTKNVTDMHLMFEACSSLTTIYVGNGWNTDKVTASDNMFLNCTNLVGGAGTKYDANHIDKAYAHIDGGPSNPGYLTGKGITPSMNLQEFINANAGATGVVDVDLSKFQDDLERTQTLYVGTGANYHFINGTLTRNSSLEGPILMITEGSSVDIETSAAVGGLFPDYGYTDSPVIILNQGTLRVRGTVAAGHTRATNVSSKSDVAIQMKSDADVLSLIGGNIYGPIMSEAKGSINLVSGEIGLMPGDYWSVSTYGDINLGSEYSTVNDDGTGASNTISSSLRLNLLERQGRVFLHSALSANVSITGMQKQLNDIIVAGYGERFYTPAVGWAIPFFYDIKEEDLQKISFTGSQSYSLSLEKNAIYLRESSNLQEFINANAGATDVVEVDLSKFENDLVREQTLTVSTGASYRFINGTLSRSETLDAPVVYVSNGSKMEVGSGAVITSQGHLAADPQALFKVEATVKLNKGSLTITNGKVEGACGSRDHGNVMMMTVDEEDPAVELTSDNDTFLMTGGELGGYFLCTSEKADVRFMGGEIYGHYYKKSTVVEEAQQASRRATPYHDYEPLIDTRSNVYINKVKSYWGHRGSYSADEDKNDFCVSLHGGNVVYLQSGGMDSFGFTVEDKKDGDLVMVGDNYTITASDMACMSVNPFRYYSESLGHYVEQECYLELKNNKVYLRYKTTEEVVCDADDLLRYIESLSGTATTNDDPAEAALCDEPTIDQDVDIEDDLWLYLYGDDNATPPVVGFYGGAINIKSRNGGWTFKGVGFTSKGGAMAPQRAAGGSGGITSVGTLTFDGCTLMEGDYTVQNLSDGQMYLSGGTVVEGSDNLVNSGKAYLDGSVKVATLYNNRGGRICVTSALQNDMSVRIGLDGVEAGVPIILGSDGYSLSASDASRVHLILPDGYEAVYDVQNACIFVQSASGISAMTETLAKVVKAYDTMGREATERHKGLSILRMSDGTVKKVISDKQ